MPKPRKRKKTNFETEQTKSVFFTGNPNKEKLSVLINIQTAYTNSVNAFLELLDNTPEVLLPVVKNNKHNSYLRSLEKGNRDDTLGSAMSQAAFDDAVTLLFNRYEDIIRNMRRLNYDIFTSSKVLFCMSVQGKSKDEMASAMEDIAKSTKQDNAFYLDAADTLRKMPQADFDFRMNEFMLAYSDSLATFRIPHVRKMWVSLDSRTCKLEKSADIQTSHVLCVTNPGTKGKRIYIPVETSKNSLRRMEQYGYAKSCHYTITNDGRLRVSVAFEKHIEPPKTEKVVGVDTGIVDCLYTSEGTHYGSFKEVSDYYKDTVEPALGELSSLRNKKMKILHYLRTHNLPADVRRSLIAKVDRLEGMIQAAKAPQHKLRSYNHQLEREISKTVDSYINSIDKSTLTVLELLDIREFNKGKKANGKLSMFAREQLQQKLTDRLNWYGYDFVEVDPAYTSQLCPVCSVVDKNNRKEKQFRCTCCGYEQDADYNAACNIKSRIDDAEILKACEDNPYNANARHTALKKIYETRHEEWLKQN